MKVWIAGEQFRLSFVRPNGAEVATARLVGVGDPAAGLGVAVEKVQDIAEGRAAGRRWRELLSPPQP